MSLQKRELLHLLHSNSKSRCRQQENYSVIVLGDHGDTTFDPVGLFVSLLHWEPDFNHEVGRVTRRGKRTESFQSLVERALVGMAVVQFGDLGRFDPNAWHLGDQHLWMRLREHALLLVPSAAFNKEAVDEGTVGSWLVHVELALIRDDFKAEVDLVDSDGILSREVLLETSQETLREVEARHPEDCWSALVDPLIDEGQSRD